MTELSTRLHHIIDEALLDASEIEDWGRSADYIPPLAQVDPRQAAVSVCLPDGTMVNAGESRKAFSIQSISKVFSLALAMGRYGDLLWQIVGREPSGTHFASLAALEANEGRPRNPFENAGAIATTGALLKGYEPRETLSELVRFVRDMAGDESILIDAEVARLETESGFRNTAIANFLRHNGILTEDPDRVLGTYFHQCAIEMTTRQLARAGATLAQLPCANITLAADRIQRINALMLTCGLYNESGDFAFEVGLPAKSGVGGGLLISVPYQASIAIWTPGLNAKGNPMIAIYLAKRIADEMGWSIFAKPAEGI
ncbi:glutaminase A [Thalassorhabdomicrobium marinisediminis]|uniref:glutaminase A n=1 Tax=Thalassorhabdomicrobium marinisediminis TaxID=2170577 RepID=UPI00248F8243|nr:glutaminase A [Thalassorhabdomicrobium marinisediminis]